LLHKPGRPDRIAGQSLFRGAPLPAQRPGSGRRLGGSGPLGALDVTQVETTLDVKITRLEKVPSDRSRDHIDRGSFPGRQLGPYLCPQRPQCPGETPVIRGHPIQSTGQPGNGRLVIRAVSGRLQRSGCALIGTEAFPHKVKQPYPRALRRLSNRICGLGG